MVRLGNLGARFMEAPARGRVAAVLMLGLLAAIGCSSGSGGGGPLRLDSLQADGAGDLPEIDLYVNGALRVRFSRAVDPETVTETTFRVLVGPAFTESVPGTRVVEGRDITFYPQLPVRPDLADAGFQPGGSYRVELVGDDGTVARGAGEEPVAIRTKGGRPLEASASAEFSIRTFEPLFFEDPSDAPLVTGLVVDLNGDGVATGDGDARTSEPEEFLGSRVSGSEPFVTDVPVGSFSLAPPYAPLSIAILVSEPLDPRVLFAAEDLVGLGDAANPYDCDPGPGVSMCASPIPVTIELQNDFDPRRGRYVSRIVLTARTPLAAEALHVVSVDPSLTDLAGNTFGDAFDAAFTTGSGDDVPQDALVEMFDDRSQRDEATSALWSLPDRAYLRAGLGWGGDGSDGDFVVTSNTVLDTTGHDGIWNFSSFEFPVEGGAMLRIVGDKPAVIRVLNDVFITQETIVDISGEDGMSGSATIVGPLRGGAGGPGGGDGGTSNPAGNGQGRSDPGTAPVAGGGGDGGVAGLGPGGGGGGAHRTDGTDGRPGSDGDGSQGLGGLAYGLVDTPRGGAGGGGGGGWTDGSDYRVGGSGGGGGGALTLEVAGSLAIRPTNTFTAEGGRGGHGIRDEPYTSGGGGGGGGFLVFRMLRSAGFIPREASARGGTRGAGLGNAAIGGDGSDGYIVIETPTGAAPSCFSCEPAAILRPIDPAIAGISLGVSRFYDTNLGDAVRYAFDAADPATGEIFPGAGVLDVSPVDDNGDPVEAFPNGLRAFIRWSAAQEDPERPGQADPATITEWTSDISTLDGLPLIRFEVRFVLPTEELEESEPALPGLDDLRVRLTR